MSTTQQPQANKSMVLFVVGALTTLFGLFMYAHRVDFAEFFLGAHLLFGLPLTGGDAFKVLFMAAGSGVITLMGIIIVVAGIVVFSKTSGVSQTPTATVQS
jgi:hypothetical protein